MAQITGATSEKIFQLKQFFGLNENPDGDTKLKIGEAAAMRNFRVTRDGNLTKRPGTRTLVDFAPAPVKALWQGSINGHLELLAACGDALYKCYDDETGEFISEDLGFVNCDNTVHIFGFGGKAYVMDGTQYLCYDGTMLDSVDGYRPLVAITVPPDGGGEILEQTNKLNGSRRAWFSPDGSKQLFVLPEENIKRIDYVKSTVTGEYLDPAQYITALNSGTVTFRTTPDRGVNTIEIGWTMAESDRAAVEQMRFSELYNGLQDSRVFIYGDGSNKAFYSGLDYDGNPRADYFPDLNVVSVGDENTPITGMIRHYSKLVAFKSSSTWGIAYGSITLADGSTTPAFYTSPINRAIGNEAPGQCQLVLNSPYSLFGNDVYQWVSNSAYSATLGADERQAKRISDRIYNTLSGFDFAQCICYDDNPAQEYYICYADKALVYNYAVNAWYTYTGLRITSLLSFAGETYIGTADGKLKHLSDHYLGDDGKAIDAYWESGSMSFGSDYMRKYSAMIWIGTKPQDSGEVTVTVQTDRKSTYTEKVISSALSSFRRWNFAALSFRANRKPSMAKLKIKAKKFVFYKLIFESNSNDTTTTILAADIRVRFTGYAK